MKVDKEYVDAQIESIDKKYEACINDIVKQMGSKCDMQPDAQNGVKYPIGFVVKDGRTIGYVNENAVKFIGREMFNSIWTAKVENEKKQRESGKKAPTDLCFEMYDKTVDLYNMNIEKWKLIIDSLKTYFKSHDADIERYKKTCASIKGLEDNMGKLKKALETKKDSIPPKGLYVMGKHISLWFFYPVMFILFWILGIYCYGYYEMKGQLKEANHTILSYRDFIDYKKGCEKRNYKSFTEIMDSVNSMPTPPNTKAFQKMLMGEK